MISQKSIQEVFGVAQVQDLIEEYVSLKRRGVNLIGLCPFHDEKTPSFTVSPAKNIYKCFGCGKGGGPVQFLMEHDSLSFPEAIRQLAAKYNVDLEEDSKEDSEQYAEQKKLEESYYILNKWAADHFIYNLHNTQDGKLIGLSYFQERGFLSATLEKFELGFSSDNSKELTDKALKLQYNETFLKELGLTSKKGYDFFRNRVMFPIHNVAGKVIAFAGRTLSSAKSQPKYINSPETPIYNKRKVLYGIHLAKNSIRKKDNCIVVEGYTDVISLVQNGVENVVASSGTAFTQEQVRLIKRYTDNVTFIYDGDAAGVKAALRGLDIVLENGMNVSLVLLPDGEDPDSFIKASGNAQFENYVAENSKDFIFFKMELLMEEAGNDPIKKSKMIKDIIASVAKLRDPIKRSLYVRQCSQVLHVEEAILVKEVNKQIRNEIKQKELEKVRLERQQKREAERGYAGGNSPADTRPVGLISDNVSPLSEVPFPQEAGLGEHGVDSYHELDFFPEEQVNHQQQDFRIRANDYQEKDLARIVVTSGDQLIQLDDSEITVADFVYSNIANIFPFFENELYKSIIELGFKYVESDGMSTGVTQYFINHQDQKLSSAAVDLISSPYELADWERIHVYLNQKMPEKNFFDDSMQAVLRFKLKKMSSVIDKMKKRIIEESGNEETTARLLKAFRQLQLEKKELAEQLGNVIS